MLKKKPCFLVGAKIEPLLDNERKHLAFAKQADTSEQWALLNHTQPTHLRDYPVCKICWHVPVPVMSCLSQAL